MEQGGRAGGDQVSMQVESGFQASLAYQKWYKMRAWCGVRVSSVSERREGQGKGKERRKGTLCIWGVADWVDKADCAGCSFLSLVCLMQRNALWRHFQLPPRIMATIIATIIINIIILVIKVQRGKYISLLLLSSIFKWLFHENFGFFYALLSGFLWSIAAFNWFVIETAIGCVSLSFSLSLSLSLCVLCKRCVCVC